jgi:hypothetical protein
MKRLSYAKAVKRRPPGTCYCDYDDQECYRRGHWNTMPLRQVKDRELIDLMKLNPAGFDAEVKGPMLARLVATIRHLRRVVRRQRNAMRP